MRTLPPPLCPCCGYPGFLCVCSQASLEGVERRQRRNRGSGCGVSSLHEACLFSPLVAQQSGWVTTAMTAVTVVMTANRYSVLP